MGLKSGLFNRSQTPTNVNKTRSNPALRDWHGQFTPEFPEFVAEGTAACF